MSESKPPADDGDAQPSVLRSDGATVEQLRPSVARSATATAPVVAADEARAGVRSSVTRAPVVHVVGFWRRFAAAVVDFAIVVPCAAIVIFLVSKIAGVALPASNMRPLDVDLWIDLALATDPALVMATSLFVAIGLAYLFVFHVTLGRTIGMRLLKIRVIDVYGDRPGPGRCAARCAGYMASVATVFLGFLWMGFDSEKRALQDWIAGTYVIRG
ncbi:MAG: RDD family protein [Deltaproteobacteria bacterium]|nr:RDD family protein [Deltaproteobacteria bacterium]